MKRIYLLIIAFIAIAMQYSYAQTSEHIFPEMKMTFGAEKDKQIIEVAKKICAKHAPDFDITDLVPVIYNYQVPPKYSPIGKRAVVTVNFMRDVNDVTRQVRYSGPKTVILRERAKAVIYVYVFPDTMEPAGIGGEYYGMYFLPSYQEFCESRPDSKLKKIDVSKQYTNTRSLAELTKEELEKKGYHVTFGKKSRHVEDKTVEDWEEEGYTVIME